MARGCVHPLTQSESRWWRRRAFFFRTLDAATHVKKKSSSRRSRFVIAKLPQPVWQPLSDSFRDLPIPRLADLGDVARWLEVSPAELDWFADIRSLLRTSSPEPLRHYRRRWFRKRHGEMRLIESPKSRLKTIQRRILRDILDHVPPHETAHGFVAGRNLLTAAASHVGQSIVLRMDLKDFFPSIRRSRVAGLFRSLGYPAQVATILAALCTTWTPMDAFDLVIWSHPTIRSSAERLYRQPHLSQGSPTSPALANLCAYKLDARLSGLATRAGAQYSRYADDLVFSGGDDFRRRAKRFVAYAASIVLEEDFNINFRKTRSMARSVSQHIVGLVVNDKPNIPRRDFDTLKAILHNCIVHGAASQNREQINDFRAHLSGRIGFVKQVNQTKGERLERMFSQITW